MLEKGESNNQIKQIGKRNKKCHVEKKYSSKPNNKIKKQKKNHLAVVLYFDIYIYIYIYIYVCIKYLLAD